MRFSEDSSYVLHYDSYINVSAWYEIRQMMLRRAEETHPGEDGISEAVRRKVLHKADEMMLRACEKMFRPLLAEHFATYDFMKRLDCNAFGLTARFISSETLEWTITIPTEWMDTLTKIALQELNNGLFGFIHTATVYEQTCQAWMFWWQNTMPKQLIPAIEKMDFYSIK